MILKALYDYYNRCGDLAPTGMEYKEISFLVVIDEKGNFKHLERRGDAKNGQKFLVMKGVRSGTTPKPYLFWDNVEYVFDYCKEQVDLQEETDEAAKKKLEEEIAKTHDKNVALIEKFKEVAILFPEEKELRAVCDFYDKGGLDAVKDDSLWPDVEKKPTVNVSFLVEGHTKIVAENSCLRTIAESPNQVKKQKHSVCLITGEKCEPITTTTPTPIEGGQPTARLVAFQTNKGYDSYGKSKCLNAPMSKDAEAAFTTALNRLLAKGSHNKFKLGNRTFVFWASSNDEASQRIEDGLFELLDFSNENDDDPNAKIEEVRKVFQSISSGELKTNLDDRFYILGLAPNAARIAVVYWSETSLKEFAAKIEQHFYDMEIVDNRKERKPYMGLHTILSSVTRPGSDVTPNLPEMVAKSIFEGIPYPYTLFISCIQRIRAENGDERNTQPKNGDGSNKRINKSTELVTRAAILKAYLNRLNEKNNKKMDTKVDKQNSNPAYLCGRLFAVLVKEELDAKTTEEVEITEGEKTTKDGKRNNKSCFRTSYLNAASTAPSTVFPILLNISVFHSDKLEEKGHNYSARYEKLKEEIISKMGADGFPNHLSLDDQGRFFVGYYHQMQDLYKPNGKTAENESKSDK